MNAERLLEHYGRIADAPNAIARLRRFILDLAVRGKLVPQDPNDEPASELLKRTAAEKARLIKAGTIKGVEIDPVDLNDVPFQIVRNWAWTRLGSIGDWGSGSTPSRARSDYYGGGITWLKSGELNDNRHLTGSEETVTKLAVDTGSFRLNRSGDVLIAMYGATIGKLALLAEDAVTNQAVCGCTAFTGVFNDFLFLFLLSHRERFRAASEGGAQPNISKAKIISTHFPLPPLAEQRRIIAKVDELMVLCDTLEATRTERETTRDRLSASSLARLSAPNPDSAIFADHARSALESFKALTTRPDQIKHVRQTILNLAVRGKLVPQKPNDEPASELLEQIAAQKTSQPKARSSAYGGIKPLNSDAALFPVAQSWVWVHFGDIVISRDRERIPVSKDERNGRAKKFDYYGASGVIDKIDDYLFEEPHLLIGEDGANLINRSTPVAFIARGKYWVNNHAHVLDGISEDFLRYLELFINAIDLRPYVAGTAQPKLNQAKMNSIPVALPSLAEQKRIVTKVDELMALCDRLETSLSVGDVTRSRLLDALLAEALTSNDSEQAYADVS